MGKPNIMTTGTLIKLLGGNKLLLVIISAAVALCISLVIMKSKLGLKGGDFSSETYRDISPNSIYHVKYFGLLCC